MDFLASHFFGVGFGVMKCLSVSELELVRTNPLLKLESEPQLFDAILLLANSDVLFFFWDSNLTSADCCMNSRMNGSSESKNVPEFVDKKNELTRCDRDWCGFAIFGPCKDKCNLNSFSINSIAAI